MVLVRASLSIAILAVSGFSVTAQIPDVPGVPSTASSAASSAAVPSAVPSAPTRNLWSFLLPSSAQCASHKQKCCNSTIGKLLNSMLMPMSGLTGGLIGPTCPEVNPADLLQPADSAEGAAARIKADEAGAKARIEALRYLATVDCRYYPEAEAALINGLRADKNECVRIEAAKALLVGCCCGKKVIAALLISVNGEDKDGHPGERSECVRAIAYLALQRCLQKYVEPIPPQPEPGEAPPAKKASLPADSELQLAGYYEAVERTSADPLLLSARRTAARGMNISRSTLARMGGQRTLMSIISGQPSGSTRVAMASPSPAPAPVISPAPALIPASATKTLSPPTPPARRNLLNLWDSSR